MNERTAALVEDINFLKIHGASQEDALMRLVNAGTAASREQLYNMLRRAGAQGELEWLKDKGPNDNEWRILLRHLSKKAPNTQRWNHKIRKDYCV